MSIYSLNARQMNLLKERLVSDICSRSIMGILAYIIVWWIITEIVERRHKVLELNWDAMTVSIMMAAVARMFIVILVKKGIVLTQSAYALLIIAAMLSALVWGISSGVILATHHYDESKLLILIATIGISSSGALTLSCSRVLIYSYLVSLLLPIVVAQLIYGKFFSVDLEIALIVCVYLLSLLIGATQVVRDYQSALVRNIFLDELSSRDPLTGIQNKRILRDVIMREQDRLDSEQDYPCFSIAIADIDNFKRINDRYGHVVGDECIKATAEALRNSILCGEDSLIRFGGDEFLIILPGSDAVGATAVGKRALKAVEGITIKFQDAFPVKLTISVGFYTVNRSAPKDNINELLNRADHALMRAKSLGKNQLATHH